MTNQETKEDLSAENGKTEKGEGSQRSLKKQKRKEPSLSNGESETLSYKRGIFLSTRL